MVEEFRKLELSATCWFRILIIGCRGILDHEPGCEVGNLMGECGFFNTGENLPEILVGVGCFVDGILSSVEKDVVVVEFLING